MVDFGRFGLGVNRDGAAFDGTAGEVLGKLAMPFAGLGRDCALGSRPFFCRTAQIETLVRHHCRTPPDNHFGGSNTARKK